MLDEKTSVKITVDDDGILLMLNGPVDDVLTKGTVGFQKFLKCVVKRMGKPGAAQVIYGTVIDTLEQDLADITGKPRKRCTCQAEAKPEEPTKHMSPAEYSAFMDAWMSQATQEEKAELVRLAVGDFTEHLTSF